MPEIVKVTPCIDFPILNFRLAHWFFRSSRQKFEATVPRQTAREIMGREMGENTPIIV